MQADDPWQADAPCSTGSRHIFLLVRLLRPIKQVPRQPPHFLFINALNMVRIHIFPCLNYNIWCMYTATDREGDGNRCGIQMRMLPDYQSSEQKLIPRIMNYRIRVMRTAR